MLFKLLFSVGLIFGSSFADGKCVFTIKMVIYRKSNNSKNVIIIIIIKVLQLKWASLNMITDNVINNKEGFIKLAKTARCFS